MEDVLREGQQALDGVARTAQASLVQVQEGLGSTAAASRQAGDQASEFAHQAAGCLASVPSAGHGLAGV